MALIDGLGESALVDWDRDGMTIDMRGIAARKINVILHEGAMRYAQWPIPTHVTKEALHTIALPQVNYYYCKREDGTHYWYKDEVF